MHTCDAEFESAAYQWLLDHAMMENKIERMFMDRKLPDDEIVAIAERLRTKFPPPPVGLAEASKSDLIQFVQKMPGKV